MSDKTIKFETKEVKFLEFLINVSVGFPVGIYAGTGQKGETEWQIMPLDEFESEVEPFWDWHIENNKQWFETPIEAGAEFVRRYHQFIETWHPAAQPPNNDRHVIILDSKGNIGEGGFYTVENGFLDSSGCSTEENPILYWREMHKKSEIQPPKIVKFSKSVITNSPKT